MTRDTFWLGRTVKTVKLECQFTSLTTMIYTNNAGVNFQRIDKCEYEQSVELVTWWYKSERFRSPVTPL